MALDLGPGLVVQELLLTQEWLELFESLVTRRACEAQWEALTSLYANTCPTSQPLLRCWNQLREAVWQSPLRAVVGEIEKASPEFTVGRRLSRALAGRVQHLDLPVKVGLLRALGKARGALAAWAEAFMRLSEPPILQEWDARGFWNSAISVLFLGNDEDRAEEKALTLDVDMDLFDELEDFFEEGCQLLGAQPELPVCEVPAPERVAMVADGCFKEVCSFAAEQASAKEAEQIMHGLREVKVAATEVAWGRMSAAEYGSVVQGLESLLRRIVVVGRWRSGGESPETRVPSDEESESD